MQNIDQVRLFFTIPVLTIFVIEYIQRSNLLETFKWTLLRPNAFFFNYIILIDIYALLFALIGCLYLSAAIFVSFSLLSALINAGKLNLLGENFYPWDIFLYKQVINLFPNLYKPADILHIVILIAIVVTLFRFRKFSSRLSLSLKSRFSIIVFSSLLLWSMVFYKTTFPINKLLPFLKLFSMGNQKASYSNNGFVLAFLMNVETILVSQPEGYKRETVLSAVEELKQQAKNYVVEKSATTLINHPNIIVIMNESFWDPTALETVTFHNDPIPTFRSLQKAYTSGWLLSPVFGGITCNAEFEFLTGFSMNFFKRGSIPYLNYINKPIPSLASVLKKRGYDAIAIHPYSRFFWNREKIYEQMGFDAFISKDNFVNPMYKGNFISDEEVSKAIIQETYKSQKPTFIFAITMQNHPVYKPDRYKNYSNPKLLKKATNLSKASAETLETYLQGVRDADAALNILVSHYEKASKPTMIVFFGDHLPILGENHALYKESGFIKSKTSDYNKWTLQELKRMRSVPIVIWTNYKHDKINIDTISPSFISPIIFKLANLEPTLFQKFLNKFRARMPGLTSMINIDVHGALSNKIPRNIEGLANQYWLLQYDLMLGEQYSRDMLFN